MRARARHTGHVGKKRLVVGHFEVRTKPGWRGIGLQRLDRLPAPPEVRFTPEELAELIAPLAEAAKFAGAQPYRFGRVIDTRPEREEAVSLTVPRRAER